MFIYGGPLSATAAIIAIIIMIILHKKDKKREEEYQRQIAQEEYKRKIERKPFLEANPPLCKELEGFWIKNPPIALEYREICVLELNCYRVDGNIPKKEVFQKTKEYYIRAVLSHYNTTKKEAKIFLTNRNYKILSSGDCYVYGFSDIECVETFEDGIVLALKSGDAIPIFISDMETYTAIAEAVRG